jgi:hypothetical protein
MDNGIEPAKKCGINIGFIIGSQYYQSAEILDALE